MVAHDWKTMTQDELKKILSYDPTSGEFRWLVHRGTRTKPGDLAGSTNAEGYRRIGFHRQYFYAHRLAWLYMFGRFPDDCIDHINGDRLDNRIINLREVSVQENNFNIHPVRAKSGLMGTHWDGKRRKWVAVIQASGKRYRIGWFSDKHEAHDAYLKAKARLHT